MKQHAFQVKFNVLKPKYKAFVVSGIVLATTQAIAVQVAKQTMIDTLKETKDNDSTEIKLLSASPLKNDFFLIAKEDLKEENEQVTNK